MLKARANIERLCQVHQGRFIEGQWSKGPYMVIDYKGYELVMDYYTVHSGQTYLTYTRMRTAFKHKEAFKFRLRKATWLSKLLKSPSLSFPGLSSQKYRLKGSREDLIGPLIGESQLVDHLNFKRFFNIEINQKTSMGLRCGPGESGVIFYIAGGVKREEPVEEMVTLMKGIVDALVSLNYSLGPSSNTDLYKIK